MAARLLGAAVVPSPPALVPEVAAGAAPELDDLRAACEEAVRRLVALAPETITLVATGSRTTAHDASDRADLGLYGLPLVLGGGPGPGRLPLGLALGTWLLDHAGWRGERLLYAVRPDAAPDACAALAAEITAAHTSAGEVGAGRAALLVVGDGSARREERSPRWPDARAVAYDSALEQALGSADLAALQELDPGLAAELVVDGRAPWQVLAAACEGQGPFEAELLHSGSPYGVGYFVATWARSEQAARP